MSDFDELKSKYHQIKMSFSKEDSWDWWEQNAWRRELNVYQIDTGIKKMSFRAYDDSPSVSIYDFLSYIDYGGDGLRGDPVSRIREVTGMSFIDAIKTFLSWTGEDLSNFKPREMIQEEKAQAYKMSYLRNCILARKQFSKEYDNLAKDLFRGCTPSQQKYAEKVLHIGYIEKNSKNGVEYCERIFIPEMDEFGVPFGSYRYNRSDERKGLLRKNSKRVLFGSHMTPKYGKYVLYVEGHSDGVINIAKRYSAITTGSATKKIGENIHLLQGKIIYDFPDWDIPGIKGAMSRREEILAFNKEASEDDQITHHIFLWADWSNSSELYDKIINNKMSEKDSDLLYVIKDEIPLKKEHAHLNKGLIKKIQIEYCKKKKWDFSNHNIDDWRVILKGKSVKYGFDFADFYQLEKIDQDLLINFLDTKVKF